MAKEQWASPSEWVMIFTPSQPATSCSLKRKAIIYTPTSVRSFPREDERSFDYTYKAGPKKEVVLMGTKAFTNFLISIQGHIGTWNNTALTARSGGGGPNAKQAARELVETQGELIKTRTARSSRNSSCLREDEEEAVDKDEGPSHRTRCLGTPHQCLYRSSQL
jgi:hypothetical protein